jgi:hypothetical protein
MPAMAERTNDFSWSRSRDGTFHDCRRRYFYQYYGCWGGWEAGAPEEVRHLWILKQLATRQMWAGRTVHEAIEMALHVFREGREVPVEPFIADVIERMRGEWRQSRDGHYRETPRTTALFEHEYAVALKPEVWQALSRNVATCLRNFFRLPLLAAIRKTVPEHWSIEHWSRTFEFEGTPIWMAPDFGFWTEEGRLVLVDWKTGASDPEVTAFQLGCYALYAREVLDVPPTRVELYEANLREPLVTPLAWSEDRLGAVVERLRLSIRSMKAYLADAEANRAVLEDFERTEELRLCRWCNFRVVCRPELQGF